MKKKKVIPLIVAISLALSSCNMFNSDAEVTDEAPVYTAVRVTSVDEEDIEKVVTYNGKFEAVEQVSVIAKLTGTVTSSYKNIGDKVNKGDSLYTVDDSDINLAITQAKAQADAASIAIASAQNAKNNITGAQYNQNILSIETSIENVENQLETATEAYNFAEKTYNNVKTLYNSGVSSKVELDQAELNLTQSKASITALETQLSQLRQSYDLTVNNVVNESQKSADIGIAQATASANSASLAVQSATKNLADVTPTSPISGVVSFKGVTKGQMVSTGTLAYTISNIDQVVATINVTENVINKINVGDSVDVSIQSLGMVVPGKVTEINPVATQTSTYPVKITIDNTDHTIKPGMFCEVEIVTEKSANTISLPREAVLRNMEEVYVYVVVENKAIITNITTGIDNGKEIEILSGLQKGDKVITEGQTYVSDGEQVNVID